MSEGIKHLIEAVREGNLEWATVLIDAYGLSYSPELSRGYTLLRIAVEKNHVAIVDLLFDRGYSPVASGAAEDISLLHLAARNGNVPIVKQLLNSSAVVGINDKNKLGETPLTIAVMRGCSKIVELLLKYGAEVNENRADFDSPIHLAVRNYKLEIAELLLKSGADMNYIDGKGQTPLVIAVERECLPICKLLLKYEADVDKICEPGTDSPLLLAVRNGYTDIVELLLIKGANVNQKDELGETPLAIAVQKRCVPVTEVLINHGADLNAEDEFGKTALHLAVLEHEGRSVGGEDSSPSETDLDNEDSSLPSDHHGSCEGGDDDSLTLDNEVGRSVNSEIATLLLSKGANVNAQTEAGFTALHISTKKGIYELVDLLLSYNASVDLADRKGVTALHIAAQTGNKGLTTKLLVARANIEASTETGYTALHIAVIYNNEELVELLLKNGALVNCMDTHGYTPLQYVALGSGNKEICSILLSKGAEVNVESENVRSVLHNAVISGHIEMVTTLLENGAQVNRKDRFGDAPLHFTEDPKIIETLLEFGAIIDSKSEDGITALHLASKRCEVRALITLLHHGADINLKCDDQKTPLDYTFDEDYPGSDDETMSEDDARHLLLRHQVKMKSVGLSVVESQGSARYEEALEEFRNSCQVEVRGIENEFINGTNISYYDILRKDQRFLAKYMDDENVALAVESEEYKSRFPIYATMIKSRFRRGSTRSKLLKQASQVFNDLPDDFAENFLDYLGDENLAVLIDV